MGEVGISNHRWKKYFSFLDRGPKTLKFSASFVFFSGRISIVFLCISIGALIHIA